MSDGKTLETHARKAGGAGVDSGLRFEHTCIGGAEREAFGGPYPLYDAPRFASFSELVEHIEAAWGTSTAFEPANEQAVSYRKLIESVARKRMEMNRADEGRFVEV